MNFIATVVNTTLSVSSLGTICKSRFETVSLKMHCEVLIAFRIQNSPVLTSL